MKNLEFRQSLFETFLKVFLVVSTVLYWPNMMAYKPQEIFIQYGCLILFGLSLFVPQKREISNAYLGMLLLFCTFSTLILKFEAHSQLQLFNMFLGIMAMKIIAERIDLDVRWIGKLFIGLALVNICLIALQVANIDPIFQNINYDKMSRVDVVGFMGARFALGCIGALMTPFVFAVSPWACIVLLPLLYYGQSSTAVAAFALCFMFLMWFKNKWAFWGLVGAFTAGAVCYVVFLDYPTGQFMKRLKIWWYGINLMKAHPWFGHGLGGWAKMNINSIQQNGVPEQWVWAHNEYLQFLFEMGAVGTVFLYSFLKNFIKNIDLAISSQRVMVAASIVLGMLCVFHFPFHIGRLASISIVIVALMLAHTSKVENEETT